MRRRVAPDARIDRLVVRVPNWLGDAVMALPALGWLRAAFPGAHLAAASTAGLARFFESVTGLDQVLVLEAGSSPVAVRVNAARLRAQAYDAGILLTNSVGSSLPFWRAGIPRRWGYANGLRTLALTRGVPRGLASTRFAGRHHSRYYLRLVEALAPLAPGEEPGPLRLGVDPADAARIEAWLATRGRDPGRPLVGVAPGAAYGTAKQYPPALLAAALIDIVARTGAQVVWLGAVNDRPGARALEDAWRAREASFTPGRDVIDAVGYTTVGELLAVVASCHAVVANDSGVMHVAGALGVPVTAVFGPTDERATAPLGRHEILVEPVFCRPCLLRECPIDHRCMKRIAPGRVAASVAGWITGGDAGGDWTPPPAPPGPPSSGVSNP